MAGYEWAGVFVNIVLNTLFALLAASTIDSHPVNDSQGKGATTLKPKKVTSDVTSEYLLKAAKCRLHLILHQTMVVPKVVFWRPARHVVKTDRSLD